MEESLVSDLNFRKWIASLEYMELLQEQYDKALQAEDPEIFIKVEQKYKKHLKLQIDLLNEINKSRGYPGFLKDFYELEDNCQTLRAIYSLLLVQILERILPASKSTAGLSESLGVLHKKLANSLVKRESPSPRKKSWFAKILGLFFRKTL
jgi:hypothetical protein